MTFRPIPSLPDYKRDVQFTINGQFQPVIKSKAGQTEIWVLSNISDMVYVNAQLTETATGKHPKIAVIAQDGIPYGEVRYPRWDDGTRLVIPPATRYAIAVTMPESGDLILEMPPRGGDVRTMSAPGILYTNDGTDNPPATLGYLSVPPSAISYADGFFVSPTQILAKATTDGGQGVTTEFAEGQKLGAESPFQRHLQGDPRLQARAHHRRRLLQRSCQQERSEGLRLCLRRHGISQTCRCYSRGSVRSKSGRSSTTITTSIRCTSTSTISRSPIRSIRAQASRRGPEQWYVDNANVPVPTLGLGEGVIQAGTLSLRMSFDDFTGLFVMHCHRLNHEDNGLMTLVNVIPAISTYAVAVPGSPGHAAEVKVYDGNGDKLVATVTPFPGYEGTPSVTMGDVDDDGVYDLVVGAGKDHAPEIVAYAGKAKDGKSPFATELARFEAFDSSARGGVSVASSQIDGSTADNIIVGSGPGIPSEVKVFSSKLPSSPGTAPELFSTFNPYLDDRNGVSVASGFVDFTTGRYSIVTAPGPGSIAQVKVFNFSLMPLLDKSKKPAGGEICEPGEHKPAVTNSFMPFGLDYRGGLSLATGWLTGPLGGAETIVAGQLTQPGEVKVFTSGSRLQGGPAIYLASTEHSLSHSSPRSRTSFRLTQRPASAWRRPAPRSARIFS